MNSGYKMHGGKFLKFYLVCYFTDVWPLASIPCKYRSTSAVNSSDFTPLSSIASQVSSKPHHNLVKVPGIGEIPNTWIGQLGKMKIGKLLEQEELRPIITRLKQDLNYLANTCIKALTKLDAENHEDSDISTALQLCAQYSKQQDSGTKCKATKISELWIAQHNNEETLLQEQSLTDHATGILGESLVDVITQKNCHPPDVSLLYCKCMYVNITIVRGM